LQVTVIISGVDIGYFTLISHIFIGSVTDVCHSLPKNLKEGGNNTTIVVHISKTGLFLLWLNEIKKYAFEMN